MLPGLSLLAALAGICQTTPTSMSISPHSAAVIAGTIQTFTATCTYSDYASDDCTLAGGVTWTTSRTSSVTVTSGGVASATDPGTGLATTGWVIATVTSFPTFRDRAWMYGQHSGDTWYLYPTPQYNSGNYVSDLPALVVGSTIAVGTGVEINTSDTSSTGHPYTGCDWTSSNNSIATVTRYGLVTGLAPGSVTLTCNLTGNAVWGTSTVSGWQTPGNYITMSVVQAPFLTNASASQTPISGKAQMNGTLPGSGTSTTWYVRPDGGTPYVSASQTPPGQCSGKVNAAYPGTGVNQPCAMGNLRYLWTDEVTSGKLQWMISGGDTVIVAPNSTGYNMGLDSLPPGSGPWSPVNCQGNDTCYMPTVPSGSALQHTRILGANWNNCADVNKTLLIGSYGNYAVFNTTDSQFVDINCFEITDKAACSSNSNYINTCGGLDWGHYGILESAMTANVNYSNLFIHGMGDEAVHGPTGANVFFDYVHMRGNPLSGIDMDDDVWGSGNMSVAGGVSLTNSITEFSGCVEEYPVVHNYPYIECRDQTLGGYGDGFGTASTTGDWYFNNDIWRYNYQDGLDLLHSGMQGLTVLNSQSYANDGQSYKIGSGINVYMANNLSINNCYRILYLIGDEPSSAIVPGATGCRAAGDWIPIEFDGWGTYRLVENTFTGYSTTVFDMFCDGWDNCSTAATTLSNNAVVGIANSAEAALPGLFFLETGTFPANEGWATRANNDFYNMKTCQAITGDGEFCTNPSLTNLTLSVTGGSETGEEVLDTFNITPGTGSVLIDAGVNLGSSGQMLDIHGTKRPSLPSIGAVEP